MVKASQGFSEFTSSEDFYKTARNSGLKAKHEQ
jgi:hypothetical protein